MSKIVSKENKIISNIIFLVALLFFSMLICLVFRTNNVIVESKVNTYLADYSLEADSSFDIAPLDGVIVYKVNRTMGKR